MLGHLNVKGERATEIEGWLQSAYFGGGRICSVELSAAGQWPFATSGNFCIRLQQDKERERTVTRGDWSRSLDLAASIATSGRGGGAAATRFQPYQKDSWLRGTLWRGIRITEEGKKNTFGETAITCTISPAHAQNISDGARSHEKAAVASRAELLRDRGSTKKKRNGV